MISIDNIREQNPWWLDISRIKEDPDIKRLDKSPFVWRPSVLDEINFESPLVYTLRGPRQVGKTTSVKIFIKKLLDDGISPSNIMYYSLDLCVSPDEIVETVRLHKSLFPKIKPPVFYFFDEVSSVAGWQKAIKYLKDSGVSTDDWFLLTGSSATDIRRGAERLPGRRGESTGLDKILLPMSFVEASNFISQESVPVPSNSLSLEDLLNYDKGDILEGALLHLANLETLMKQYFFAGGLPRSVRDFIKHGTIADTTIQTYTSSITGEIEKFKKSKISAFKLLKLFASALSGHISWSSVAESAGIASKATTQEYAELLSEAFIILVLYFFDLSKMNFSPKKNKKIYFIDPLFYYIAAGSGVSSPLTLQEEKLAALAENMAAIALFRNVEREMVEIFFHPQHIFYWHSSSGKEVDFLVLKGKETIPIEVKYQNQIRPQDLLTIKNSFGRGIVLSKKTLNMSGSVKMIPLPLFLWVLKAE